MNYLIRLTQAAAIGMALAACPSMAFDGWKLESSSAIPGKNSAWDYVSLDTANNHLFIGRRGNGLQVFDLATAQVIQTIAHTAANSANGATLIPASAIGS